MGWRRVLMDAVLKMSMVTFLQVAQSGSTNQMCQTPQTWQQTSIMYIVNRVNFLLTPHSSEIFPQYAGFSTGWFGYPPLFLNFFFTSLTSHLEFSVKLKALMDGAATNQC